jgi:hypothetical protein
MSLISGLAVMAASIRRIDTRLMAVWGTHELQHRYREALFGQAPFDELPFSCRQPRFEHVVIAINIALMTP